MFDKARIFYHRHRALGRVQVFPQNAGDHLAFQEAVLDADRRQRQVASTAVAVAILELCVERAFLNERVCPERAFEFHYEGPARLHLRECCLHLCNSNHQCARRVNYQLCICNRCSPCLCVCLFSYRYRLLIAAHPNCQHYFFQLENDEHFQSRSLSC